MKKLTAFLLAVILVLSTVGCASAGNVNDLMDGVETKENIGTQGTQIEGNGADAATVTDFAIRLFRGCLGTEENTMISPVSVLYALAMTANGAKGDTLAQMETVFGANVADLNAYLRAYKKALPEGQKYKLSIANSIWLTDDERFTVVPDFLQTNADYYGAGVFQVPFDAATCRDINRWVEDNTDGMIKDILDKIPAEAVMYLVNAMAFEAEWQDIYYKGQVTDGVFTTEDGKEQSVDMMHSDEHYYLEDDKATGFLKHYADREYAFVALLPNEGVSVEDYVASLTGEGVSSMLASAEQRTVITAMPRFESEYSVEMSEILGKMGMTDAFRSYAADFSGLGHSTAGNIFISRVLHKTFISVGEKGTKAGAATVVEASDESAMESTEEIKKVILDRPFVYMIIDCEERLPLFVGTLVEVAE